MTRRKWLTRTAFTGVALLGILAVFGGHLVGLMYRPDAVAGTPGSPQPLAIMAVPVSVPPASLNQMKMEGAWELSSDNDGFGGLSGLILRGDEFLAVTDKAQLLRANWSLEDSLLRLTSATLTRLVDQEGVAFSGEGGDAESLALVGDDLLISFERQHRILRRGADGRLAPWAVPDGVENLSNNGGMEAIATLPDGSVLVMAEDLIDNATPLWLIRDGAVVARGALPFESRHQVTGATVGPSGRLYLVRRYFSVLEGVGIRIERYALKDGFPDPQSREELAAFESSSGIDNMEGIALVSETSGEVSLWVISDDNFNLLQRTLLLRFVLAKVN